ncbi:regulatory helix-turn-helix LysR family protein [Rhizobium sp. BK068]|nr:regulatory helix-turn-helix LysR family protein [Rhizobium sp. BK068]
MALEKELGCPLFIRSTRRVELTRAGETFYDRCVRILSEVDLTTELTRAAGGSRIRQIKSGTMEIVDVLVSKTRRPAVATSIFDLAIETLWGIG